MRRLFERDLASLAPEEASSDPDCGALGAEADLRKLSTHIYACFGNAARHLSLDGDPLDRLTILGLLPRTDDPERRRRLFFALAPVWQSVNGDGSTSSPYRRLLRQSAKKWHESGSPVAAAARDLGVEPTVMVSWLESILEKWYVISEPAAKAAPELEPWDFLYAAGASSRALSPKVPFESLSRLNEIAYATLGASPAGLGVQYDLGPRDGKTPVAFTTFGARGAFQLGRPEPWVFAVYRTGGLDNLAELLHETGHAIHIAAIRTRPAFRDWPDSDVLTEALGDLVALEVNEPAWQARFLGASAPLADCVRGKYAGIVLDVAWALFEMRLHERPDRDPNEVWTEITSRYLRIRPHPEVSWWAVRGPLVSSPGYMANYALGAVIVADLRERIEELKGPLADGGSDVYPWLSERLYRFGLERPSRAVIEDFLGRPPSPRALLDDMDRAR